jgi:predicted RNase H-like nuclease (RuvC/YqgF family)
MRAMKEALKKQKEREKARVPIKGQADVLAQAEQQAMQRKSRNQQKTLEERKQMKVQKAKAKKALVELEKKRLSDISERGSSEERADEETRDSEDRKDREKSSLADLAGTLDQLAEEYGQLTLRQAMERKFAELPSSGQGMSKKQLNQIILDKNRVIGDLEETAYSKGKGMSRSNPWVSHVKQYAKDNGITYSQAMKQAKSTYKK